MRAARRRLHGISRKMKKKTYHPHTSLRDLSREIVSRSTSSGHASEQAEKATQHHGKRADSRDESFWCAAEKLETHDPTC